jgi:monovalent cation/hydrogen antiporter
VMRIQGESVWEILTFLLNAMLFLLVGLQLPRILDDVSGQTAGELLAWGALVSAVVIGVRLLWVFTVPYVVRALDRREVQRARRVGARQRLVTGWCGMRGSVSLAAALALPFQTDAGAPFPERDVVILLAFAVIFATLVGQGLTLGPLIRRLRIVDDGAEEREEVAARVRLADAGIARVEELRAEEWVRDDTAERTVALLDYRRRRFAARADGDGDAYEARTDAYRRLMYEVYDAQREMLIELRNQGEISDEVRRRMERELDLEEWRIN